MSWLLAIALAVHIVLAAVLAAAALRSWRRLRSGRMPWVAFAFVLILAQGLLLAATGLWAVMAWPSAVAAATALEAAALAALYVGMMRV